MFRHIFTIIVKIKRPIKYYIIYFYKRILFTIQCGIVYKSKNLEHSLQSLSSKLLTFLVEILVCIHYKL